MSILPAAWGDDVRLAVVVCAAAMVVLVSVWTIARLFADKEAEPTPTVGAVPANGAPVAAPTVLRKTQIVPDLDPEEWISGNVIHLDRHRAVGLIRCDRVKSPVQFRLASGRAALPRVGDKVRFKGRHGARRRPVADVVERAG